MRCLSCDGDVKTGAARCPHCGFPILLITEDTKEAKAERLQLARQYFQKKLSGIQIRINTYTYQYQAGRLSLAQKREMLLANAADLQIGKKIWHSQKFGAAGKPQTITFPVMLTFGHDCRTVPVKVEVPKTEGFNYIGVVLDAGLSAHIVVGDDRSYGSSEAFSLIEQEG